MIKTAVINSREEDGSGDLKGLLLLPTSVPQIPSELQVDFCWLLRNTRTGVSPCYREWRWFFIDTAIALGHLHCPKDASRLRAQSFLPRHGRGSTFSFVVIQGSTRTRRAPFNKQDYIGSVPLI